MTRKVSKNTHFAWMLIRTVILEQAVGRPRYLFYIAFFFENDYTKEFLTNI
jgi:hypothetical protein